MIFIKQVKISERPMNSCFIRYSEYVFRIGSAQSFPRTHSISWIIYFIGNKSVGRCLHLKLFVSKNIKTYFVLLRRGVIDLMFSTKWNYIRSNDCQNIWDWSCVILVAQVNTLHSLTIILLIEYHFLWGLLFFQSFRLLKRTK